MLGGPNYETVAELKMLQLCGVDAVGKGLTKFIVIRLNMEEEKYSLQIVNTIMVAFKAKPSVYHTSP